MGIQAGTYRTPVFVDVAELNRATELFSTNAVVGGGPFVIVVDGFYSDPDSIRQLALEAEYVQYFPPEADQVSEQEFAEFAHYRQCWCSTCLLRYRGAPVKKPFLGCRYAPLEVRERIEAIVGERVKVDTWASGGDGWNGAFHVQSENWKEETSSIHHHFKEGDIANTGWSGVVYLTPGAPVACGTSIYVSRATGKCVASFGATFDYNPTKFNLALRVDNRYNRLVLFRENVLHQAGPGFGSRLVDERMTQTFFFETLRTPTAAHPS
jgi:hypothetical protein